MRRLATVAVVAALISPTAASGQDYTFGDWARDQGYSPGDAMPSQVDASDSSPGIDSLNGIGEFDWITTPTMTLRLSNNQLSSIESGDFNGLTNLVDLKLQNNELSNIEAGAFSGLANLTKLWLYNNQLSSIESGDFSGLANLTNLNLDFNQISSIESGAFTELMNLETLTLSSNPLTELNLEAANFLNLTEFNVHGNQNISTVSLKNSEISQTALAALLGGGDDPDRHPIGGIGHLDGITEMDLSGIDFADITDLEPLYVMEKLTDLWLVNTQNVDATALDILLDNLETIEDTDTEGILYMTQADFDAFNAAGGGLLANWNDETGHHVEYLQIGDVNHDTEVNGLDVDPFVRVLLASRFDVAADVNLDGVVNGLDVEPFVAAVVGGVQQIPEPSTLFLCLVALGVVGGWRKWNRAA